MVDGMGCVFYYKRDTQVVKDSGNLTLIAEYNTPLRSFRRAMFGCPPCLKTVGDTLSFLFFHLGSFFLPTFLVTLFRG